MTGRWDDGVGGTVGLKDLIGSVAGAIVDAQGLVESRYVSLVRRYFDGDGLPVTMGVKLPNPAGAALPPVAVAVPLLSLVECNMLAIRDMTIELDVELGEVEGGGPVAASDLVAPTGAPIGIPALGPQASAAPVDDEPPHPAAALLSSRAQDLNVGIGGRTSDGGPVAKLKIRVKARPPSDALMRLTTQLNKMV